MMANLIAWVAQATVLAVVAASLPTLLRVRGPRMRLVFWQVALGLILLLPILQPWQVVTTTVAEQATVVIGEQSRVAALASSSWIRQLPLFLGVGALIRLLWLGLGVARLAAYRKRAHALKPTSRARALMEHLAIRPRIAESDRVWVPVTFGIRRPTILVPRGFDALDDASRTAVLCHEMVHVARRDASVVLVEELLRAVAWFHPGVLHSRFQRSPRSHIGCRVSPEPIPVLPGGPQTTWRALPPSIPVQQPSAQAWWWHYLP